MAPFRNAGRTNRSGRTQADHDVFEGLPIRQWRQQDIPMGASNALSQPTSFTEDWPELAMPRDSHLLPIHSQQLLRAARAGRLYKPPPAPNDDDKENGDEEEEAKDTQTGFVAKKWMQVPRHLEEPEPEYLAKRRKGLPSAHTGGTTKEVSQQPAPVREAKVKKMEADGTYHIYKVLVPEGQTVEGEVNDEEAAVVEPVPVEAAPGTVVEGVGVVNAEGIVVANDLVNPTSARRRPPPPRRRPKKGPRRGRKKVMFTGGAEGTAPGQEDTQVQGAEGASLLVKTEGTPAPGEDTPMVDAQEGDEEDEEGEEGEEGEDDEDREEGELSPTPADSATPSRPAQPAPTSAPVATSRDLAAPIVVPMPIIPQKREAPEDDKAESSPDLPLSANAPPSRQGSVNQAQFPAAAPTAMTTTTTTTSTSTTPPPLPQPQQEEQQPAEDVHFSDGEVDLYGSLERQLEKDGKS